ncbi:unnamed protein product [Caenorhabditis auriculariae]|uniref:Small acidic protein-like domain-containing protein n=1 Tax=Caenorhabditis auriculariae TaxID=2777116 RepID=A0A8S1GQY9_9PELO|nr:unnamed protein product [Caenorhabditis auriculariae]
MAKHTKFESSDEELDTHKKRKERKSPAEEKHEHKERSQKKDRRDRERSPDRRDVEKPKPTRRDDNDRRDRDRREDRQRDREFDNRRRERHERGGDFRRDRRGDRDNGGKFGQKSFEKRLNPEELAQQKKLLWGSKKAESDTAPDTSANDGAGSSGTTAAVPKNAGLWSSAIAATGVDGNQANKFMRLMGVKNAPVEKAATDGKKMDEERVKQEKLMRDLDKQYAIARESTHMGRGMGLGFH